MQHHSCITDNSNIFLTNILEVMMAIICASYIIIAIQFWIAFKTSKKNAHKRAITSLFLLILIFIFCMLSGYASKLIDLSLQHQVFLHAFLAIFSVLYIIANQANTIVKALTSD